jgi:hypothetical protein
MTSIRDRFRSLLKIAVLLLVSTLVACVVGEIVIRYVEPQPLEAVYVWPDGTLRHIPSLTQTYARRGYSNEIRFNALGLRGDEVASEKKPGVPRILFLGDSFVEGKQVGETEVLTQVMERMGKSAGHPVEVINAGVAGYGTAEEYRLWQKLGQSLDPDIVILGFYPNDVRNNVDRDLIEMVPGRPIQVKNPYENGVSVMYKFRKFFASRSHLYMLLKLAKRQVLKEETPRRRHHNQGAYTDLKVDQKLEAEDVFTTQRNPAVARGWSVTLALLGEMKEQVEATGARFMVVLFPTRFQVDDALWSAHAARLGINTKKFDLMKPQKNFKGWSERVGVPVLDLIEPFKERNDSNTFYHDIDAHWNAEGHHLAAEMIVQELQRLEFVSGVGQRRE